MGRRRRAGLALLAFFILATPIPPGPPPPPEPGAVARLEARPVPLNSEAPEQGTVGKLAFLAGWALSSADHRFGGISAMAVEGHRVTAISDMGLVLGFDVPGTGDDRLQVAPLLPGPGSPAIKSNRDIEAMAVSGGSAWIAFENRNQIWRYRRPGFAAEAHAAPPAMRRWPANRGAEAMLRLFDGRFLLISESLERNLTSRALLFRGDPAAGAAAIQLRFRPANGYRVTDAAQLPDGQLLLLQRRLNLTDGPYAKLVVADLSELRPDRVVEGREIAHFEAPLTVDNMEALSVTREGEQTIIWLASDDNYLWFQRTLLLKFALAA